MSYIWSQPRVAAGTLLLNFAKTDYFPKKVKHITIEKKKEKVNTVSLKFLSKTISKIPLESLETAFSYFGEFVEYLGFNFHYFVTPKKNLA